MSQMRRSRHRLALLRIVLQELTARARVLRQVTISCPRCRRVHRPRPTPSHCHKLVAQATCAYGGVVQRGTFDGADNVAYRCWPCTARQIS
jgi:phage FluMu protein Com